MDRHEQAEWSYKMITTWTSGMQTGQFSRIVNPRLPIADEAIDSMIATVKHTNTPTRNPLAISFAGVPYLGTLSRVRAWLRGDT
jgi:hypothetical protein